MKHRIKMFLLSILRMLVGIVPKNKKLWIFGAWQGKLYADNSKAMFEYVNTHHPEINAVWITREEAVEQKVKDLGYQCCRYNTFKGLWLVARAAVAFETEGEWDISQILNIKKTKVIQLWHGTGFKALKWKSPNGVVSVQEKQSRARFSAYYWASSSDLCTDVLIELLGVPKDRFVITGLPRNDNLLTAPHNEHMESLKGRFPGHKFMIYMPTHRNFGIDGNRLINITELKRLDGLLCHKNMVMVYKPHFHELKNLLPYENEFSNIILAKEQEIWGDVYAYMHCFDLLISDYSSAATDFMCTGKPVIYFPYDVEDYMNGDSGLYDYFWKIPGGPFCYTWDEVVDTAASLLMNDTWKEEREKCRVQYHYYNDGKNCERVYNMALEILNH